MSGAYAALVIALCTGVGVYRSCTKYQHILVGALVLDALLTCLLVYTMYLLGAWGV